MAQKTIASKELKMRVLLSCLISVSFTSHVVGEFTSECQAWSDIGRDAEKKIENSLCVPNNICTGLNCSGSVMGENFIAGIEIQHCEKPLSIKLFADVPQLGIHNWQQSFVHGNTFKISDEINGEIVLLKEKDRSTMDLKLKLYGSKKKYLPLDLNKFLETNILNNVVPVPSCDDSTSSISSANKSALHSEKLSRHSYYLKQKGPEENCTITRISCRQNEMCQQINKTDPHGVCVCLPNYSRNRHGYCMYSPETTTTDDIAPHRKYYDDSSNSSGHGVLIPILVSVAVMLLVASLVYAAIKLRFFQYLRRRLRVRVYEQVLLGQDDDNDEQLADPIA